MSNTDFQAFKSECRNAPVIHVSVDSISAHAAEIADAKAARHPAYQAFLESIGQGDQL